MLNRLLTAVTAVVALTLSLGAHGQQLMAVQTYYVPLPENEIRNTLATLNPGNTSLSIESVISIAASLDGTVIVYDHWEDGYEADIEDPEQASTQVWGDGDITNGDVCGLPLGPTCVGDVLSAGDVIVLQNEVDVTAPADPTDPLDNGTVVVTDPPQFNGRDKFASTQPLAVTRVAWAPTPGTVLAGAVEVFSTDEWGAEFEAPVGEDIASDEMFELVTASYMASQDNTLFELDLDQDGTIDFSTTLNQGETLLIPLDFEVPVGALAVTDKPVQLHAMTGDIDATWESRWYVVLPNSLWNGEYFVPVSTRQSDTADPTDVFVYNPNDAAITVNCDAIDVCTDTAGVAQNSASVPAGGVVRFRLPNGSGARFSSGSDFYPVATIDANGPNSNNGDSDLNNRDYDWGFALVPTSELSTQALVGFAPAIDPTACALDSPYNCNPPSGPGSPVWVMSAGGDTDVYVDFDGDGVGPETDPEGNQYDLLVELLGLQNAKIFAPDGDNTGTLLYTLDGTLIAVAWGQDPENSVRTNPYFDAGTYIPALPLFSIAKTVDEVLAEPGDTLTYTVVITNTSRATVPDVMLQDDLPPYVTYVEDSTFVDGTPVDQPDGGVFPLATGVNLGDLPPGQTFTVTFQVTVNLLDDPDDPIVIGDDPDDVCLPGDPEPDNQTALINNATVTALGFEEGDDALTCVEFPPDIDIRKQAEGPDTRTFVSGSDVTFEIKVENTGLIDLQNVVVTDLLAPQCDRNIGNLAVGEMVTYECTVPNVTESFDNEACVDGDDGFGNVVEDCDPSTVEIIDIDIRKQAEGPDTRTFPSGSDVPFEIVVTNTGDEDLSNVVVTDVLVPACDNTIGFLAAGDSVTYTCTAPNVTASFDNEACVAGERGGVTVEDCDPSTVEIIDIDIRKQEEGPDTRTFPSGSDVPFEIVVTNTGDEDLSNVVVTDVLVPACDNTIGFLAAGDSVSYTCIAPNVAESFTNEACVAGERNGVAVEDCDPSTVEVEPPPSGITRTLGYWKNHPTVIDGSFDGPGGFPSLLPLEFCGESIDEACDAVDFLDSKGGGINNFKRQGMAALLNCQAFGCSSEILDLIEAGSAACASGANFDFGGAGESLDFFNNSGDNLDLPFQSPSALPKFCK